jgi:hypothetical protein
MDNQQAREGEYRQYSESLQPKYDASQILQNPNFMSTAFKGMLTLNLIIAMFFSGFISVATYLLSKQESAFLEKAVKTEAYVTDVYEKKQIRETRSHKNNTRNISRHRNHNYHNNYNNYDNYDNNYDTKTEISYIYIVSLRFRDKTGKIYEARLSDGENSMFKKGDKIDILYNSENPSDVRFFKNSGNAGTLKQVSQIAGIIFVGLLFIFLLSSFLIKNNKEEIKN